MLDLLIELLNRIFLFFYDLFQNYGLSLIFLSIVTSVFTFIIGAYFNKYSDIEIEIQKIISPQVKKIKLESSGKERHKRIQNLYKKYSYSPIYTIRTLIPFIVQLPFLISAYFMLYDFKLLNEKSFGIVPNLNAPDELINGINLLPIIMTLILIFLTKISKKIQKKQKNQSYVVSFLFLFLLYESPPSLIIFWTSNSLMLFFISNIFLNNTFFSFRSYLEPIKKLILKRGINTLSLTLLLLPFLIIKSQDDFFLYYLISPTLILFLLIDLFFYRLNEIVRLILYVSISLFFYSLIFYNDTLFLYHSIRFRYFCILLFILFFTIYSFIIKFHKERITNIFLLILSFLVLITGNKTVQENGEKLRESLELNSSKLIFETEPINDKKPVILLIIDELGPSQEIFNYTGSFEEFDFDKFLKKNNFIIKPDFRTHSTSTKISTSSMLNFNLGKSKWIKEYELKDEFASTTEEFNTLLKDNLLVKQLNEKGVKSYSFGKVDFTYGSKYDEEYFYLWDNLGFNKFHVFFQKNKILRSFFLKTILSFLDSKLHTQSFLTDGDRKQTFETLESILLEKNSFYFFHLDAPHHPFSYFDEFPLIDVEDCFPCDQDLNSKEFIEGYILYRRFILKKIIFILKQEKFKESRIILVGDHGLRQSEGFDPNSTFGAFLGFDNVDIKKLNEAQDVSSLIDHYLN